jgi:hypothetical protein
MRVFCAHPRKIERLPEDQQIHHLQIPCVTLDPRFHFCGPSDLFESGYSAIEISEKADRYGDIFALFGGFSSGLM